jgi:hypothetical protein
MGLDWIPGHRPRPGHEAEFRNLVGSLLWDKLGRADRADVTRKPRSFLARLFARPAAPHGASEAARQRYEEIGISAFETLNAPRVGFDPAADEWARTTHAARGITKPLDDWLREMRGYYVLDLVPPCDGIPLYSNGVLGSYVDRFSFRAQFLKDTTEIIGDHLLEACYEVKFAPDLAAFGRALLVRADAYARVRDLGVPETPPTDHASPEGQLHVVICAGRWCVFWGERGHFLEPSF